MRNAKLCEKLCKIWLCLIVWFGGGAWLQAQTLQEKTGPDVFAALQVQRTVRVVVALQSMTPAPRGEAEIVALQSDVAALQDDVLTTLQPEDFRLVLRFRAVPALVGHASQSGLSKLASHPAVRRIDLDVSGHGSLAESVPLIEADQWQAHGVTGNGVVVAVLDTGIDADHDDLEDDLIHEECFLDDDGTIDGVGRCPDGSDRQSGTGAAESGLDHGIMTAGIITSGGVQSPVGVAPDAKIVAIKVLDDSPPAGSLAFFSEIVAALDFIITDRPDVRVINMSLGTDDLFPGDCDNSTAFNMAGAMAVDTLRSNGVITFAASGNDSSGTEMSSPACLSNVVSVGATDDNDNVAGFTNSNAMLDVMAPGVDILAPALANGTGMDSGTSFASPHAAGCAALLIHAGVATTPDQIEHYLEASSILVTDPKNGLQFPRIDCFRPEGKHAVIVLDRTGSMLALRSSGNSRCADALALAKQDVASFFAANPENTGASLAVWTFAGSAPTNLTNGFVGEVEALAALDTLTPEGCNGSTPLADALCGASDALVQAFPTALPDDRILAVSSDGEENASSGVCSGPSSISTMPPYDPGSWQQKVRDQILAQGIAEIRFWGSVSSLIDVETGQSRLAGGLTDNAFFQELANASGGSFVRVDDNGPLPPPFFGNGAVPAIPTLSVVGLVIVALLLLLAGLVFLSRHAVRQG